METVIIFTFNPNPQKIVRDTECDQLYNFARDNIIKTGIKIRSLHLSHI